MLKAFQRNAVVSTMYIPAKTRVVWVIMCNDWCITLAVTYHPASSGSTEVLGSDKLCFCIEYCEVGRCESDNKNRPLQLEYSSLWHKTFRFYRLKLNSKKHFLRIYYYPTYVNTHTHTHTHTQTSQKTVW